MNITTNVSVGELLDKLSILEIKKDIIKDENKLIEIDKEIKVLMEFENIKNTNLFYYNILKWINLQIWLFTDTIKSMKMSESKYTFASISNKIFNYNQYRFRVKNMLNFNSNIKEQKSYAKDIIKIKVDFYSFYSNLEKINILSILYDQIIFCTKDDNLKNLISNIYKTSNFLFSNDNDDIYDIKNLIINDDIDINTDVFKFPNINYISGGLLGDFIHQLSICNENFIKTGCKANIYISDNNLEKFSLGAETTYNDLKNILNNQLYINSFKLYNNEENSINLSIWRQSPLLYNTNWYNIFHNTYNLEWAKHKWISTEKIEDYQNIIFLNVSTKNNRYVNLNYNLLNKKHVIFLCFNKKEYDVFCESSGTKLPFYVVKDIDEMFRCINSCYCFIGNLSSPLAFAISMHKYCIGLIGENMDTIHMKDLNIPNYYYYQNENSFTKNVYNF